MMTLKSLASGLQNPQTLQAQRLCVIRQPRADKKAPFGPPGSKICTTGQWSASFTLDTRREHSRRHHYDRALAWRLAKELRLEYFPVLAWDSGAMMVIIILTIDG